MAVIVLGVWVIVATQLGVPFHPWLTIIFVVTGVVIAAVGFFLRADAIDRGGMRREHRTFVENSQMPQSESTTHEHKERITSLN